MPNLCEPFPAPDCPRRCQFYDSSEHRQPGVNVLRPYQEADVEQVIDVWDASTRLAHPFLSEEFLAAERENLQNLYLPNTETTVWDAEALGGVVGFIALLCGEAGTEIGGLFVAPPAGRQGIGQALLQHARDAKGELEVEVFEANPIGRAFYAKQGFLPIGQSTHEATGQGVLRLRLLQCRPD